MDVQLHDTYFVVGIDQLILVYGGFMALSGIGYFIKGVYEGKYVWLRYLHFLLSFLAILLVVFYLVNFQSVNADVIKRDFFNWMVGFVHVLFVFGVILYIINVFLALFKKWVKPN